MRIVEIVAAAALAAGLAIGLGSGAQAAPAAVNVTIGPELQAQAEKTLGVRDVNELAADLKKAVTRELAKSGAYEDARIDLVLVDAKRSRPTFKELSDRPGLSYQSISLGGAEISGRVVTADGHETPVSYRYYETDLRNSYAATTWSDAYVTIDRFAHDLRRGRLMARR